MKTRKILLLTVFFLLTQNFFSQEKSVDIKCDLTINETIWNKDLLVTAAITVKNNSDKEMKIYLPPDFKLVKQGRKIYDSKNTYDDKFSAKEMEEDHIILKKTKTGNITSVKYKLRQFFEFSLKSGEVKTVEFSVSKLAWNSSVSSVLLDNDWFKLIPRGNYDLYYQGYYSDKEKKTQRIYILSNSIKIVLNSEN